MIKQPYGPSLGELDCEDMQDFSQYYKGRYFACTGGLVGLTIPNDELIPCYLYRIASATDIHLVYLNPSNDQPAEVHISWDALKAFGKFGHPLLGTFPYGPTYSYASQAAYRESTKGVGLSRIAHHVPGFMGNDYGTLAHAYVMKRNPTFLSDLHGKSWSSHSELKIVKLLYNKQMFEWQEALKSLEKGERLGCNISAKAGIHFLEDQDTIKLSYKDRVVADLLTSNGDTGDAEIRLKPSYQYLVPIVRNIVPGKVVIY